MTNDKYTKSCQNARFCELFGAKIDILVEKTILAIFNYICGIMGQQDVLHNISIKKFKDLFPEMPGKGLGEDLLIADLKYDKDLRVFQYPFRLMDIS